MTAAMHERKTDIDRPDALVDTRSGGIIVLLLTMLMASGAAVAIVGTGAISLLIAFGVVAFIVLAAAAI